MTNFCSHSCACLLRTVWTNDCTSPTHNWTRNTRFSVSHHLPRAGILRESQRGAPTTEENGRWERAWWSVCARLFTSVSFIARVFLRACATSRCDCVCVPNNGREGRWRNHASDKTSGISLRDAAKIVRTTIQCVSVGVLRIKFHLTYYFVWVPSKTLERLPWFRFW